MLNLLFKRHSALAMTSPMATRNFGSVAQHSRIPREKDYYSILGVTTDATPEQIKEAYRVAVKKHHPDVAGGEQPDSNIFRDVMEAYSVLSVNQSRVNYDLLRKKRPDDFKPVSEEEFNRSNRPDLRDAAGNSPVAAAPAGSYAAERLAELKQQREKYNVNDLGYYRGGLPQKGRGAIRGAAIGLPGEFHQPTVHNYLENYHQDSKVITSEDAVKFKAFMNSDKVDFNMSRPTHPMHYDRDMNFMKDRSFFLSFILGSLLFFYLAKRFRVEQDRWTQWDRRERIEDLPAHHFNNRGGVLIKKQFVGFEKYHRNIDDMMDWYKRTKPYAFKSAKQ